MPPSRTLPSWTTLPATFVTTLITGKILKATTSSKEKGLITVFKAVIAFVVVLAITTVATKIISLVLPQDQDGKPVSDRPKPLAEELSETGFNGADTLIEAPSDDQIAAWRNGVREIQGQPPSAQVKYCGQAESIGLGDRESKKLQKKESKKIWRAIVKEFKPKRKTLLGGRKEATVEVEIETED